MSHWLSWLIVVAVGLSSVLYAYMAWLNVKRLRWARATPPLLPGGASDSSFTPPWETGDRWVSPDEPTLSADEARRYADLAAGMAEGRRFSAELLSVVAAAGVGALLPAFFTSRGGSFLFWVGVFAAMVPLLATYGLRLRADFWELVADAYDGRADQISDEASRPWAVRVPSMQRRALLARQRRRQWARRPSLGISEPRGD